MGAGIRNLYRRYVHCGFVGMWYVRRARDSRFVAACVRRSWALMGMEYLSFSCFSTNAKNCTFFCSLVIGEDVERGGCAAASSSIVIGGTAGVFLSCLDALLQAEGRRCQGSNPVGLVPCFIILLSYVHLCTPNDGSTALIVPCRVLYGRACYGDKEDGMPIFLHRRI